MQNYQVDQELRIDNYWCYVLSYELAWLIYICSFVVAFNEALKEDFHRTWVRYTIFLQIDTPTKLTLGLIYLDKIMIFQYFITCLLGSI